jgi:(+)-trans-carveol dehydrogenase
MGTFDGKVALITGAARGQGRSHAVRLASEGADIVAIDICDDIESVPYDLATPADLQAVADEVEALGRRVVAHQADVRNLAELKAAVDDAVDQLGRLDIVAANAGITSLGGPAHELSEELWSDTIGVNLTGVWHTVKAAVPHIIAGGRGGSIILTSSVAGLRGYPNVSHYTAAKHGVVGLMRSLTVEFGQYGIRVNSVHPTQVNTAMIMNPAFFKLFVPDEESPSIEKFAEVSQDMHVLPTPWVEPEDVSNVIAFLASDQGRYITGATIPVDAGAISKCRRC